MKRLDRCSLIAATCSRSACLASGATTGVAPAKSRVARSDATELSARRAHRGYVYRPATVPYYPAYYARPATYRPYPYAVPAPFFLGFAYLPFW